MGLLAQIGGLDAAILIAYLVAIVAIGFLVRRQNENEESFVRGNRALPFWAVGLSMMATAVGADDFVANPQFAFKSDCALLGAFAVGYLGLLTVAIFFLPRFYRSNALTIYGYLGQRFGPRVQVAASLTSCVGNVFSAGVGLFIAAIAIAPLLGSELLNVKTGTDYRELFPLVVMTLLIAGVIGTAYTTIGGIRSVVWTDVLQTVVIFAGGLYAIWFLLNEIPLDWQQMTEKWSSSPDPRDSAVTVNKLRIFRSTGGIEDSYSPITLGLWAVYFVGIFGTNHNYTQRLLACKSATKAGVGMVFGYSFGMLSAVMFLLIGLLAYLFSDASIMGDELAGSIASSESVYPWLVVNYFPAGLLGISLAAMLAAVMSTFDSATAAIASSFVADVIRPIRKGLGRSQCDAHPVQIDSKAGTQSREISLLSGAQQTENPCTPISNAVDQQPSQIQTEPEAKVNRPPMLATVITGTILTLSGVFAAITYDPQNTLLVDFVLGVSSFPIGGMLGVFCCALFTSRGNEKSAIAALLIGPLVWLFVQPDLLDKLTLPTMGVSLTLPSLSEHWLGHAIKFAWPWWFSIAAVISFFVCCCGKSNSARELG